ncbi:MAG: tetratricopeptide repeat protein [Blastomonas sp.]
MKKHAFLAILAPALMAAAPVENSAILSRASSDASAFDRAAAQSRSGDAAGDEALAWYYETGTVVRRDAVRAVTLYRRAALAGLPRAQWRLGVMLDEGRGVDGAQPDEAFEWFAAAANQGHGPAWASLGVMFATGRGAAQDFEQALKCYLKAASLGEAHGFYGIGVQFAMGEGVKPDLGEATSWMLVAEALGDDQASAALEQLAGQGLDDAMVRVRAEAIADEFGIELPGNNSI